MIVGGTGTGRAVAHLVPAQPVPDRTFGVMYLSVPRRPGRRPRGPRRPHQSGVSMTP